MEMLKLGKITTEELASWFNTSKNNLSKHKKEYLKKLESYCLFESIYGGINIKEIYKSIYVKNPNYQIVLENIDKVWDKSGLDTCSHVGEQIYKEHRAELTVQESTTITHTAQARNQKWGKPNSEEGGPEGRCDYVLCRKNESGKPIWLNSDQERIKEKLLKKWFGDADEKTVIVQMMIDRGEIKEEEAWNMYSRIMKLPRNYYGFMKEFKDITGIQLIRGTQVETGENACEENDGNFTF